MLLETIKWRRSYRPEDITFDTIENEAKWGKLYLMDGTFDKDGRPIVIIKPRNEHNKTTKEDAIR